MQLAALLALSVLLGGCLTATPETPAAKPADHAGMVMDSSRGESILLKDAIAAATPLTPYNKTYPFTVGPGVLEVRVNLTWTSPLTDIQVQMLDPDGKDQGRGVKEASTMRGMATVDPPVRGAWKLVVTSTRAVQDSYAANLTLTDFIPGSSNLTQAVNVAAQGFAELNLIMEGNETFDYSWATREGGATKFNIHSHENGETKYHVEGSFAKTNGTFTAPKRQVYSLMWENTGVTSLTIDLKLEGRFRVHSHS